MTAADIIERLVADGHTVATAESLTGGLVCAALTEVPGASACVRGGVVAYAVALKHELLGVEADLLERRGAIDPDVALQMARGVREVLGADVGVATTGSAGPDPAPGGTEAGPVPPGSGFVAVVGPAGGLVRGFQASGDRARVRSAAVDSALDLLAEALGSD
ncbi:MAG: hypothetical protein B7C55_00590 [Actinomycetales bacterium mxb001]|nr:MAG: hypothetical protein B7C55_00590 [Actinomycetales bacterium mxb001]